MGEKEMTGTAFRSDQQVLTPYGVGTIVRVTTNGLNADAARVSIERPNGAFERTFFLYEIAPLGSEGAVQ